jgi:hypothetical protein
LIFGIKSVLDELKLLDNTNDFQFFLNGENDKNYTYELKKGTETHLKKESEIMGTILNSDETVSKEFHKWYINRPYCKLINEIKNLCQRKNK